MNVVESIYNPNVDRTHGYNSKLQWSNTAVGDTGIQ